MPTQFPVTEIEVKDDVSPTLATSANQATALTSLAAILAKLSSDPATQTTLAALLAKVSADPSTGAKQDTQAAKLDTLHTDLTTLAGYVDGLEGLDTTIAGKDFATQTTLAAVLAKLIAAPATEAKQDSLISANHTDLAAILAKLTSDPATQTTLAAILAKLIAAPATEAKQDTAHASPETSTVYNGTTALTPKFAFANVAASSTDSSIVAAVSSKKIRVLAAAIVAGGTATDITFNSKPAGAGTAKSSKFANGANGGEVLPFNPVGWFETVAGEGLTVTTGAGSTTGVQVVYVEV